MEKFKNIDWKNVLERALWTFFQGFISTMVITGFTKEELKATLIGGLAGGLSALKTIIVELKEG
jgi:hypothetical protein